MPCVDVTREPAVSRTWTVQPADRGDTTTVFVTLAAADAALAAVGLAPSQETVLDKGDHSGAVLVALAEEDHRSHVSEPKRKRRQWKGQERDEEQRQLYANRRRVHGPRNKDCKPNAPS